MPGKREAMCIHWEIFLANRLAGDKCENEMPSRFGGDKKTECSA